MLAELIDARVIEEAKKHEREPGISPSNIGSCLRKLILMHTKTPHDDFTANQLKVFKLGYLVEGFVLDSIKDIIIHRQLAVAYRDIKGTLDAIVELSGKKILIDSKSVKKDKFAWLEKEGCDTHYAMQLTHYWLGAKAQGIELENDGCLLYVEKENCLFKEIWIHFPDWVDRLNHRIDEIEKAKKEILEVPPEHNPPIWECFSVSQKFKTVKTWCQYIHNCPNILKAREEAIERINQLKEKKK